MTMRCFVGLALPAETKLALADWRDRAFPDIRAPDPQRPPPAPGQPAIPVTVPAANLHLTLAFLGQLSPRQHEALCNELNTVSAPPVPVTLDTTGVWNGPKIIYAAPNQPAEELMQLAKQVRKSARRAGIQVDSRPFQPHVTLIRKATTAVPPPLTIPDVHWQCRDFHLFESVSQRHGVHYPIRHSWPLRPALSIREQLRRGQIER